jgi:hypothetical protein
MDVLEDDVVGGLENGACGVFDHASKETRLRPNCEHSRVPLSSRSAALSLTLGHRQLASPSSTMKLETRCLHGGQGLDPTTGSRAVTIYRLHLDQALAKA